MDEGDVGQRSEQPNGALTTSVLVLNKHYTAVRVINARRAFSLLFKENAEAIDRTNGLFENFDFTGWVDHSENRDRRPVDYEQFVRTPNWALLVPRVIRLMEYDKIPKREVKFNRRNIFARDENRCQYCGRKLPASSLSIDHIVPKSRRGSSTWKNVVTACNPCNTVKGGRLPSEAGMKLIRKPSLPRRNPTVAAKLHDVGYELWRHFVSEKEWAAEREAESPSPRF